MAARHIRPWSVAASLRRGRLGPLSNQPHALTAGRGESVASKPLPLPDLCQHHHDWSPIAAASSQSAMAAVLAGFVFAGIVAVLTVKAQKDDNADRALRLLLTAFFGLAVTAYLFADLAGEQTCPRAETEEVLAGGMLGTFAVVLMTSLTWLVLAYEEGDGKILDYLRKLIYLASGFVVLLLTTNSEGYLSAVLQYGSHLVVNILIYATGVAWVAGLVAVLAVRRSRLRQREERQKAAQDHRSSEPPPSTAIRSDADLTVKWCTRLTLCYLAVSALTAGIALSIPAESWYPIPAPWAVYAAAWTALLLPLAVLMSAALALPAPSPVGRQPRCLRLSAFWPLTAHKDSPSQDESLPA
jgi:small-conductance mechanosensitive channel